MRFRPYLSCIVLLVACGSDPSEPTTTRLQDAPDVTFQMAFDSQGAPVVLGGSKQLGPFHLQRPSGDLWIRPAQDPEFRMDYTTSLFRVGTTLHATNTTSHFTLVDEANFKWSEEPIPAHAGTIVGVDAKGTFYESRQIFHEETNTNPMLLYTWHSGDAAWKELPGGESPHITINYTVEPSGRVTWVDNTGIIQRVENGVHKELLNCNIPELKYCGDTPTTLIVHPSYITFLTCTNVYRLDDGATKPQKLTNVPTRNGLCDTLTSAPDGTEFLGVGGNKSIGLESKFGWFRRDGESDEWELVLEDSRKPMYFRDDSTAFFGGSGSTYVGIWKYEF